MDYMTINKAEWGVTPRRIQVLFNEGQGRIGGAIRFGACSWAIPKGTKKPTDARIKSGKYINNERRRTT